VSGLHKSLTLCIKAAGDPTADQLAAIRPYMLADLPPEQLYVRTFALAHNAIDRDDEAFDDSLLADFARTLPGKGLFIKHPSGWDGDSGPGEGRFFHAELQTMSHAEARTLLRQPDLTWPPGVTTATILMASAYMVRTEGNKDLLLKADAGIVSDVSIGFTAKRGDYFRDEAGREMQARRLTSPGEALEGSLVWLGAQPGARAIKGASRTEETDMPTQQELDAANTRATDFENKFKAAEPSHSVIVKAREALGDNAHLIEKPGELADAVKAGQAFRDSLIDTIVKGEREAGLCGDDEESVAAAKAIYAGQPLASLQKRADTVQASAAKGGRVAPTNPPAPERTTDEGTKGAPPVFAAAFTA
jgi:hypothetical protein